jgi:AcrR family transcriptional regulator
MTAMKASRAAQPTQRKIGRPPDADGAATRRAILEVAERRFAAKGYSNTSHRAIAEDSGLTPGAIYHYFDTKADLYSAVADELLRVSLERYEAVTKNCGTLMAQVGAILEENLRMHTARPAMKGFLVEAGIVGQRHPEVREAVHRWAVEIRMFFQGLVDEAVSRGELASDIDPKQVTFLLLALISGMSHFMIVSPRSAQSAAVEAAIRLVNGSLWE